MKNLINLSLFAVLFASVFTFSSCKDEVLEDKSVIGVAQKDTEFSIFVQAVERAGLTATLKGSGPFTIFAPTNTAFAAFLLANNFQSLNDVPVATLEKVLKYHVVSGKVTSSQLTTGYVTTLATYGTTTNGLSLFANTASGVVLNGGATNGGATVTAADIDASNGVIHKIGNVMGLPTVVNLAVANPNFSTLVGQLSRTDLGSNLVTTLSSTIVTATGSPFTVFAPTNAAFTALEGELSTTVGAVSGSNMSKVLLYHVVGGANVRSSTLTNGQPVTTLSSTPNTFTINISGTNVTISDQATAGSRTTTIVATDVQANNGVIHAVGRVLLNI